MRDIEALECARRCGEVKRVLEIAQRVFGAGHGLRPNFIVPYRCKNILIEDVHIINSPMWELNPVLCTNITVRGVDIHSHGPNNDGCDPDSCKDVLIENCTFDTGDDCIAIKSGKDFDGRRVNIPSFGVRPGFVVALRAGSPVETLVRDATDLTASVAPWLQADHEPLSGTVLKWPERAEIDTPVQESLIVELYSK